MVTAIPIFNIHDVVLFVALAVCLLLSLFQFFYPNRNETAKYLLIFFLLDIAIGIIAVLVFWLPTIQIDPIIDNQVIPYILFASLLLKGPLLYTYTSCVTTPGYKFARIDSIHLLPLVIYFLTLLTGGSEADSAQISLQSSDKWARALSIYDWHSVKIIPLVYAVMAALKAYEFNRENKKQNSELSAEWLLLLTWGCLFNWSWSLATHMLGIYIGADVANLFGILDNYITAILVSSLFTYSWIVANRQLAVRFDGNKSTCEKIAKNPVVEKIVYCMETEKLFLNPRLNIERMAEHIKVPYREVSALINQHFQANFNEYINVYRINEAKRLLADTHFLNLPINEIYAQAGFNSKSAFHRFFNRLVGISPSEYRKLSIASIKSDNVAAE